jgi:hypothetical protein
MGLGYDYDLKYTTIDVVIASGQTDSGAVNIPADLSLVAIDKPDTTGTALQFKGSSDGTTYTDIWYDGAVYSETVPATAAMISLQAGALYPYRQIKVVSGSSEASERTLTLMFKNV